jgi:hypothetical protein
LMDHDASRVLARTRSQTLKLRRPAIRAVDSRHDRRPGRTRTRGTQ